jgi:hypothetical protein
VIEATLLSPSVDLLGKVSLACLVYSLQEDLVTAGEIDAALIYGRALAAVAVLDSSNPGEAHRLIGAQRRLLTS